MLIRNFDNKLLSFYIRKFGRGNYEGPMYLFKKSKNKIGIKGNPESVYDFSYFFVRSSEENKIKNSATIFVPKELDFQTSFDIINEKTKIKYKELKVSGKGFFKADYFIFFGEIENEFGKIKTKKVNKPKEESDKDYFSYLKGNISEEFFKKLNLMDFKKELEYKVLINTKDLKIIDKSFVLKKVEFKELFFVDKEKKFEESKELELKHEI